MEFRSQNCSNFTGGLMSLMLFPFFVSFLWLGRFAQKFRETVDPMSGMISTPEVTMTGTRLTERTMAGQPGYAADRVLGWLFKRSDELARKQFPDYELLDATDLENRAKAAIIGPQCELFPVVKRRLPAFQLRFPGF